MTIDSPPPLLDVNAKWFLADGRPTPEFYQYMRALDLVARATVRVVNIPETPLPDEVWNEYLVGAASDEVVALTAGTAKLTFRIPYTATGTLVRASLATAQTSGAIFTVDINKNGSSILSTKLTIDNAEKTSKTAATAAVISNTTWTDDDEFTVDIDQVGDGTAKGLKIALFGQRPAP
ncbi:hypothetical protein [Mesorhizobium sp. B2-3-2]|uniref:hypothetical protein n=1 Tax=Mesorhizobium sp. B2-3-2 TaxID=2589961 RepID=UPI00112AD3E0|nr:hypothetical protein [Mesorhizobium sp. B2-3-2]TPM37050.1 hypothetical protein FJ964_30415 [Mesorhizobium sp. B2-3-2]